MKNGQFRETGNITKKNKPKTQHNMCWTTLCYINGQRMRTTRQTMIHKALHRQQTIEQHEPD
jgi:hypothetical protein